MAGEFPYSPRVTFLVKYDDKYLIYDGKRCGYSVYGQTFLDLGLSRKEAIFIHELVVGTCRGGKVKATKVDTNETIVAFKNLLREPTTLEYMKIKRNNCS